MKIAFIVSFTVFVVSVIFVLISVPINCGLANPLFDESQDSVPYIEQMRAIINVFDTCDKVSTGIALISGFSSFITGYFAKKSGQIG